MDCLRSSVLLVALSSLACGPNVVPGGNGTGTSDGTTSDTAATGVVDASDTGTPDSSGADTTTEEGPSPLELHIEAYCEAWLSVECPWPRYDSVEECIAHYGQELASWDGVDGRVFDPACGAAKVLGLTETLDCPDSTCVLFHGAAVQGDSCATQNFGVASDCDVGFTCQGFPAECQPWCVVADQGESCNFATCDEGLLCIYDGDTPFANGNCVPVPGPGDPCLSNTESPCGFGMTWCDDGICSDQYGGPGDDCSNGQPCDYTQVYCDGSVCQAHLPVGMPCTSIWECETNACVGDVCVPLPDTIGAPCHQEKKCAGDLDCDGLTRTCRQPFTSRACNTAFWCLPHATPEGVCDEGDGPDQCPPGTDAADCGYCPDGRQNDGVCDEPGQCAVGTDPDCG